jgi:agmatine deiminase
MGWRMPSETARHERTWMAFPREGFTLGETGAEREEGYAAWTATAHAIAEFEPVTMVVDPSELARARRQLSGEIEIVVAALDEFWMRDFGPTFVLDDERPGVLGAVSWIFNGWGDQEWAQWRESAKIGARVADLAGAEMISSLLVNEGGGLHVDGRGTVLLTETVQLDPHRNRYANRATVEAELARTIGATKAIWLPRGLSRDYDQFGTNGHVDIVATMPSPGRVLLHTQRDPGHPDFGLASQLHAVLEAETDATGQSLEVIELPAPATLRDTEGFVDWSYVNHLVVNDAVIGCGFGEPVADQQAAEILAEAYPGRRVVSVDARPIFARGGGVHCITQQQPRVETVSV